MAHLWDALKALTWAIFLFCLFGGPLLVWAVGYLWWDHRDRLRDRGVK